MKAPIRHDWATDRASDCWVMAQLGRGITAAEAIAFIATMLRDARAKGYAEGLQAPRPITLAQIARCETSAHRAALNDWAREHLAPADHRAHQRQTPLPRLGALALQDETQADHDDTVLAGHPGLAGCGA